MMFFPVFLKKWFLKIINWNAMFCTFLCNIELLAFPLCWDCLNRSVGNYWLSFESYRLEMVSGLTSDSYNCCSRNFGLFPLLKLRKVWFCLNMVILVCFFRSVFSFCWWWGLVRVSDFRCKPDTPDLTRLRNRKFSLCIMIHCFFW